MRFKPNDRGWVVADADGAHVAEIGRNDEGAAVFFCYEGVELDAGQLREVLTFMEGL